MDPSISTLFGRQARYDSFPPPPHFPDSSYHPHRHPPFAPFPPHPPPPQPPMILGNYPPERRRLHYHHPTDDPFLFTSPYRPNSPVFNPLPVPRVSVTHEVFDEGSERFPRYHVNSFHLGDPDPALVSRRRIEFEQDRLFPEDSEWRNLRYLGFWDGQESRCGDVFSEQIQPEDASLATPPPLFSPPRGLRHAGSVHSGGEEASGDFEGGWPSLRSPHLVSNGVSPHWEHSVCNNSSVRNVPAVCGLKGRKYMRDEAIKKSNLMNVAEGDNFWSIYNIGRKLPNIASMDYTKDYGEDSSIGSKGKRKVVNDGNAKYHARPAKRCVQKASAFSRIQSGVSVWERLEEKASISSPASSLPCSLSSPSRISRDNEPNADTIDLSFKSNSLVAKVVNPLSPEPSCIKRHIYVVKKNRSVKKKKKVAPKRERVVIPIVSVSTISSIKQGFQRTSSFSNLGSDSEPSKSSNKALVPSCRTESKSMPGSCMKKSKKLVVAEKGRGKVAVETVNQVKGGIIGTPRIEKCVDAVKFEGDIKCAKEAKHCAHDVTARTEPIDVRDLQVYQQGQMIQEEIANDISATCIAKYANKNQEIVVDNLLDSGEEGPLKLEPTLDNRRGSPVASDTPVIVNVCSQPPDDILPFSKLSLDNIAAQESSGNVNNNYAANLSNQVKPAAKDFENYSPLKIEQDMPSGAVSPELVGAGAVSVSADPRTPSCSDDSPKCIIPESESEREGKQQNKMELTTASEALEIPGSDFSAQSCFQQLQGPSLSELSNAGPTQKLPSEESIRENKECSLAGWILQPESDCNVTFQDSLIPLVVDASCIRTDQDFPLGPMKMDSQAMHFESGLQSHPLSCESEGFNNNSRCSCIEDKNHRCKCEAFARSRASLAFEPDHESGRGTEHLQSMPEKTQHFPSDGIGKPVPPIGKLSDEELSCKRTSFCAGVRKFVSSRPNFSASLNQTGRHRTWLRTNTLSSHSDGNLHQPEGNSSKQVPKKHDKVQNSSYIRKGNSLIRKPAAELPPALLADVGGSSTNSIPIRERSKDSESRSECPDNAASLYPLVERLKTPPLPPLFKLSGCMVDSHNGITQSMPVDTRPELDMDQGKQGLLSSNLESQDTESCRSVETINSKRVIYVKRKKNQLIAAPGSEIDDSSELFKDRFQKPVQHPMERSKILPFSSSVLYFRRKRNQLVRNASSDGQQIRMRAGNADLVDSIQCNNILSLKKRLDNVHQKVKRPSRSSLVWTLGGDKLSQKSISTFCHQRVLPHIIPWKRAPKWKSFVVTNDMPISSSSSLSLISRKLQHLRKRDTIYKVSTDGFSLRKAGVVSIGGSNLKWSKSIEKRSKRASEEATMAVAEVERKKRERKKCKSTRGNENDKVPCRSISGIGLKQGERIFRVGSARYKMDSSKRTLIRISDSYNFDDQSSSLASQQSGNKSQISFVPRRLVIGNDEYIRIGNGNQLVRDPKKLKRILASEKVRWSLHTVRLRLARKRQHCLFFTRFGKCNNRGKCPYIHDPTKVAICTKFLKGQCSDTSCKLTHKVIPERMPDCSYFLKGLCTNINCTYRHVKVNALAPLCNGFLRGHCADGDECHKKHSYTCPLFEATGKCPQGSLCKLYHPKGQSKSRKRKQTKLQSSSQGRYFYSGICEAGDSLRVALGQSNLEIGDDIFCSDGRFTEFLSLDVDVGSAGIKNNIPTHSHGGQLDSSFCDLQSYDVDALIKPVGIMNSDDLMIF